MSFSLARTHRLQRDTLRLMLELYERYGSVFTVRTLHRPLVVLYVFGSRSLDDADLLAVDRDEHRQDKHQALHDVLEIGIKSR